MSDKDLNINIKANNLASASIRQLNDSLKELQYYLGRTAETASKSGQELTSAAKSAISAYTQEINLIKEEIASRTAQTAAIKATTAAVKEQGDALAVVHRTLQQNINNSFAVGADRQMKSAAESARILATSLSAAAEADSRFRSATADATTTVGSAVEAQRALEAATLKAMEALEREAAASKLLKESLAIPEAEMLGASSAKIGMGVPAFLSRQRNAPGETGNLEESESESGGGVVGGSALNAMGIARHGMAFVDSGMRGQRGAMMSSIGAAARDAGLGVAALTTTMAGLVAIMGTEALVRGASDMGKWATESKAAASATGMTIEAFTGLQGALELMGLKGEEANTSLKHLGEQLAQAIADPASKSAEAFHNLGISQDDLAKTGGNTSSALKLLADAFVQDADGANKTENMNQLLGRGFERLIPLLEGGSRGLDENTQKAKELGLTLNDTTASALEKTGQKADELSATIKGKAIQAFVAWGPVIQDTIGILEGLGTVLGNTIGLIGRLVGAMAEVQSLHPDITIRMGPMDQLRLAAGYGPPKGRASVATPSDPGSHGRDPEREVAPLVKPDGAASPLALMRKQMDEAALAAGKGVTGVKGGISGGAARAQAEGAAELQVMQNTLAEAKLTNEQKASLEAEIAAKKLALYNEGASAQEAAARRGEAAATKAAKQSYADFASAERDKIAQANGSSAAIIAIYNEWAAKATSIYKQQASEVERIEREKIQAVNKAKLEEIRDSARTEEEINRATKVLGAANTAIKGAPQTPGEEDKRVISESQQEAAQIEASSQKEIAALTEVMNSAEKGSDVQRAAAQEILSVITQAKSQEIALYQKAAAAAQDAANKVTQPITQMFSQIGNQFESLTSSLVKSIIAPQIDLIKQGLTTIKLNERNTEVHQALQKFALDMVQDAAKSLESAASQGLANMLSQALSIPMTAGASGLSGLLSSGITKMLGIGAGSATGGLNAAQFGVAATQLQASGTTLTAAGTTLTGSGTALTAAASALTAAAGAGAAGGAASGAGGIFGAIGGGLSFFAKGGIVPSAAGGMISGGTGGTLAVLHEQEMVLPKHLSNGIQSMITNNSRGGNANLNYSPTINTASRSRSGTGMTRGEFQQMMSQHGGSMMGEARNMMRAGARFG